MTKDIQRDTIENEDNRVSWTDRQSLKVGTDSYTKIKVIMYIHKTIVIKKE